MSSSIQNPALGFYLNRMEDGFKPFDCVKAYSAKSDAIAKRMGLTGVSTSENAPKGTIRFCYSPIIVCSPHTKITNGNPELILDPTFFIDCTAIPEKFIIRNLQDLDSKDFKFVDEFINWLSGYYELPHISPKDFSYTEKAILILFLYKANNPELLEKEREFIIAHELAHIAHGDPGVLIKQVVSIFLRNLMISGVASLASAFFLSRRTGSIKTGLAALVLGSWGGCALLSVYPGKRQIEEVFYNARLTEFNADIEAVNVLQDTSGGCFSFKRILEWEEKMRALSVLPPASSAPDKFSNHPTIDERLANLNRLANLIRIFEG